MKPTIGRIVHYTLDAKDAEKINATRYARNMNPPHEGTQEHRGNSVREGSIVAAVITAVHSDTMINGQAILDGIDSYWLLSRYETSTPGTPGYWNWPPRD